ncbi:hypothetical protein FJK98_32965 [Micromonospora sp. HM134]|nr:hypothetical protein FJK98_32965 [Micromonospora sp. HM134]
MHDRPPPAARRPPPAARRPPPAARRPPPAARRPPPAARGRSTRPSHTPLVNTRATAHPPERRECFPRPTADLSTIRGVAHYVSRAVRPALPSGLPHR